MAVADNIGRGDVAGIIPTEYSNSFLEVVAENSACLSTFRTVRVGTKVNKFPVLSALPSAGFVTETTDGTGVKPKSKVTWADKTITIEEVAVIVPIHENVLADSTVDLWGQIRPLIGQAFGQVIDDAILNGDGKPSSWRAGLVPDAISQGSAHTWATSTDLATAFNGTFEHVELDGSDVSHVFAGPKLRSRLRGLRTTDGDFLYNSITDGSANVGPNKGVYGADTVIVKNGTWNDANAVALAVDASKVVVALRSDMSYKLLTEATLGTGNDALNLAERDMVALRVKMRLGWEVATNATALNASPVPYAVLVPGAGGS
jgi:HK97 family phage major capsid protein